MNHFPSRAQAQQSGPYQRLAALGIELPPAPPPIANFVTHVIEGNMLYLSGQGPREADGYLHTGKVGSEVTTDKAYNDARLTGVNLLAVMQEALGDLSPAEAVDVTVDLASVCDTTDPVGWLMRGTVRRDELNALAQDDELESAIQWRREHAQDPATDDLLAADAGAPPAAAA